MCCIYGLENSIHFKEWGKELNSGSSSRHGRVAPIPSSFLTVTMNSGQNKKHNYLNVLESDQNQAKTEGQSALERTE